MDKSRFGCSRGAGERQRAAMAMMVCRFFFTVCFFLLFTLSVLFFAVFFSLWSLVRLVRHQIESNQYEVKVRPMGYSPEVESPTKTNYHGLLT